jgi:thiol-disulfide isomerase/thioredoxin
MTRHASLRHLIAGRRAVRPATVRRAVCSAALTLACVVPGALAGTSPRNGGLGVSPARAADILKAYPLRTVEGAAVSMPSERGQVVVLSFWASWCAPCQREMPRLEALNRRIASSGASVVAVSIDEDRENVTLFARRHALHLPIVHDGPNGLAHRLDLRQLPLTLVLDRSGQIAFVSSATDEAGMTALSAATDAAIAGKSVAITTQEGERR